MRGEDLPVSSFLETAKETPPHAWGRLVIPVGAAETFQKHPHMRGEDYRAHCVKQEHTETPPHAWGRPSLLGHRRDLDRNTPTCVGKTQFSATAPNPLQKHPHMRGEDSTGPTNALSTRETPPHAWGRLERKAALV